MDTIRTSIEILFKKQNPQKILDKFYSLRHIDVVDRELFSATYSYEKAHCYNKDEIQNIFDTMDSQWKKLHKVKEDSIFNVLVNFTKDMLTEERGIPLCKFEYFLKWRELSHLLGEDLLTTAHFAYKDYLGNFNRTIFAWKPIISSDNIRLKDLLKKGVAENHFHLKGSAPHASLSWISLMNSIEKRENDFNDLEKEKRLSPEVSYDFDSLNLELKVLVKKACAIRLFLYELLVVKTSDNKMDKNRLLDKILKATNNMEISIYLSELQKNIDAYKYTSGKRFGTDVADYLIPHNISSNNYHMDEENYNGNILLYGERYFLYTYLKLLYKGDKDAVKFKRLFHTYLIIKNKFRDELVQINDRTGFGNFADYQKRKSYFLDKDIYKKAVLNMAINSSIKDQNIESLEARIAPEKDFYSLHGEIKNIEGAISDKRYFDIKDFTLEEFHRRKRNIKTTEDRLFYVVHFIKNQDTYAQYKKDSPYISVVRARNHKVRQQAKAGARAIVTLRDSNLSSKNKILGIDAANFEIGCRPEVFAQSFRYLRNYRSENRLENLHREELFNLGVTYHAGEDFLSIIDGLRAIDETVKFLQYEQGDRLGHALALGVDPYKYYRNKNYTLVLPKQVHLDNIVWFIAKCREYGINLDESLKSILVDNYYKLFSYIYNNLIDYECTPEIYYMSWKLRGDNPNNYITGKYEKTKSITFWQSCSIDRDETLEQIRKNPRVSKLYSLYHFNKKVKLRGSESEEVKVDKRIFKFINELQNQMQKSLAQMNIAIETNPSSNYVIGTFDRYDEHPISKFYNLGLSYNEKDLMACPQLSVSINTDDQGVFETYLENEYALMALAMEKATDSDGNKLYKPAMIYDWLDRIRVMGLEQSFLRRNNK